MSKHHQGAHLPILNDFTLTAIQVRLFRDSAQSFATGFLYRTNENLQLVTAWHNVSGRHFITKEPLSSEGWLPTHIEIGLPIQMADMQSVNFFRFTAALYSGNNPIWRCDPNHRSGIDIAIIRMEDFTTPSVVPDSEDREFLMRVVREESLLSDVPRERPFAMEAPRFLNKVEVSQEIFIVGYFYRTPTTIGTAVWKRGSVATEPDLPYCGAPCYLVDSATRSGLSGSPVIGRFRNPRFDNGGKGILTKMGDEFGFCGLYSGRVGGRADDAQIGIAWNLGAIETVVQQGAQGTSSADYTELCKETSPLNVY